MVLQQHGSRYRIKRITSALQVARDALARLHGSPSAPRNVATAAKVESPSEFDAPPKLQRTVLDSLVCVTDSSPLLGDVKRSAMTAGRLPVAMALQRKSGSCSCKSVRMVHSPACC